MSFRLSLATFTWTPPFGSLDAQHAMPRQQIDLLSLQRFSKLFAGFFILSGTMRGSISTIRDFHAIGMPDGGKFDANCTGSDDDYRLWAAFPVRSLPGR